MAETLLAALTLMIRIENIPDREGRLAYAVFSKGEAFPREVTQAVRRGYEEIPEARVVTLRLEGLGPGEYAVSVYQDRNGNRVLDKNFLGIPTESIGFSQNPVVRFGPPSFVDCKFKLEASLKPVVIRMIH